MPFESCNGVDILQADLGGVKLEPVDLMKLDILVPVSAEILDIPTEPIWIYYKYSSYNTAVLTGQGDYRTLRSILTLMINRL
jgi:hypothetical protein